jgi:hypothetical protein
MSYEMHATVNAVTKTLFWTTTVVSETNTASIADPSGAAAEGTFAARKLQWGSPVNGYHTDGTLTCDGHLCGTFGAPPPGKSPVHVKPHSVPFAAFDFAPDLKTFSMASTMIDKSDSPKQLTYITFSGREMKRTCLPAK